MIVRLGIDHAGREHVIDTERERVVVLDNAGIAYQDDLTDTPIETTEDWRDHVSRQLGPWRETSESRAMDAAGSVLTP